MKRVYFPGLNTIRLYAALCVVIGHTVDFAKGYHFTSDLPSRLNFVLLSGNEAVSLFFVLSGFLITYILLTEKRNTGDIAVRHFYLKRAFRILPLYILITLLALVILGVEHPTGVGLLAIIFLSPQLVPDALGILSPLWSIGVEEWFYFALPPLLRRLSVPVLAFTVIGVRFVMALAVPELMFGDPYIGGLLTTLHYMRFECMAVGALGAWLLIHQHFLLRWIYRLEIPALIALAIMILINFSGGFLINMISACIFIIFILNVATNPRRKLNLENPILSKLGTVTYGVYMYHPLVTFGVTQIIIHLLASGVATDLFLYASVAVSTLVVASVSYRWFELPVTKLRPALENKSPVVAEVPN